MEVLLGTKCKTVINVVIRRMALVQYFSKLLAIIEFRKEAGQGQRRGRRYRGVTGGLSTTRQGRYGRRLITPWEGRVSSELLSR